MQQPWIFVMDSLLITCSDPETINDVLMGEICGNSTVHWYKEIDTKFVESKTRRVVGSPSHLSAACKPQGSLLLWG